MNPTETGLFNFILIASFDGGAFANQSELEFSVNIRLKAPCVTDLKLGETYGTEVAFNDTRVPPTLTFDATLLSNERWYEIKIDTECDASYLETLDYITLYPGTATDFVKYDKTK